MKNNKKYFRNEKQHEQVFFNMINCTIISQYDMAIVTQINPDLSSILVAMDKIC